VLIGGANADTGPMQFQRPSGVARMSSGEIVVANAGSQQLRVFSPQGAYLRTHGRHGGGPGEFGFSIGWTGRVGDTLFLHDYAQRRVHAYTGSKGFTSTTLVQPDNLAMGIPIGRLSTGEFVIQAATTPWQQARPDGVFPDSANVGLFSSRTPTAVRWFGKFLNAEYLAVNVLAKAAAKNPQSVPSSVAPYRFGSSVVWGVIGDRMVNANSATGAIQILDRSGLVVAQFVAPLTPRPIDAAAMERARQQERDNVINELGRQSVDLTYEQRFRPRHAPLFSKMMISIDRNIWLEQFRIDPGDRAQYIVLDLDGRRLADVVMPAGFSPREVGADYVIGFATDDDGVQSVAMYRLTKQ
jgi:hypothetical protein